MGLNCFQQPQLGPPPTPSAQQLYLSSALGYLAKGLVVVSGWVLWAVVCLQPPSLAAALGCTLDLVHPAAVVGAAAGGWFQHCLCSGMVGLCLWVRPLPALEAPCPTSWCSAAP